MLRISLRLAGLNIYFYDVFFSLKIGSKKGCMEMVENFYLGTLWNRPRSITFILLKVKISLDILDNLHTSQLEDAEYKSSIGI